MHKDRPELRLALAKEAVLDVVNHKRQMDLKKLRDACQNYQYSHNSTPHNFRMFWSEVLKREIMTTLTKSALDAMSPNQRRFVELRYGKDKQLMAIHLDVHVSIAQLSNWNRKVLGAIATYAVDYKITKDDLFHRQKIVNLIETFASILEFFDKLDPEHEVASEAWLRCIRYRKKNYRKIITALDENERMRDTGIRQQLVFLKLKHPNDPDSSLAMVAHLDKGAVSRHLQEFIREVTPYLV